MNRLFGRTESETDFRQQGAVPPRKPVLKWLIGPVLPDGYASLRISLENAWWLYGESVEYVVCFNRLDEEMLRSRVLPPTNIPLRWQDQATYRSASAGEYGWKFFPLKLTDDRRELWLDNDLVLYRRCPALDAFLFGVEETFLFLEDVQRVYRPESLDRVIPETLQICGGLVGLPAWPLSRLREVYSCFLRTHGIPETDTHMTASHLSGLGIENASLALLYLCFPEHARFIGADELPPGKAIRAGAVGKVGMHFTGLNRGARPQVAWSFRQLAGSASRPRQPTELPPELHETRGDKS